MADTKSEPEDVAMGFKDKEKALYTLKVLDGRDISYQYHVLLNYVSRAKKTLQITRDKKKLVNLKEALQVFEDWIADYKQNNRGKENLSYLRIETMKSYRVLAKKYEVLDDEFYKAYKKVKGDYRSLRSVKTPGGETTWDVERNRRLKEIIDKMKEEHVLWFETDLGDFRGLPTKEHVRCIMLSYSPDSSKLKKLVAQVEEKFGKEEEDEDDDMEVEEERPEKGAKRSHESSSSSESSDEEPEKKIAKRSIETEKREGEGGGGLSFKDKERALQSIKSLDGRDVCYQYHAIAGLVKRAERVISCTKDEQKIKNMKEAVQVYENWITDYNVNGRSKENFNYLTIDTVRAFKPLADLHGIEENGFLRAYEDVDGDYKKLRTVQVPESKVTWDIERNRNLRMLLDRIKEEEIKWYETEGELDGLPTKEHTQCIMWAFSYDASKLKKVIPNVPEKLNS